MKKDVKKVAIVTGASSGIGKATAEYLSERGWLVYGIARREINSEKFIGVRCDVADSQAVSLAFKEIFEKEGRIDALVNNAGMGISGAVEYIDEQKTKNLYELNLLALCETCKIALPYLKQSRGIILNTSSVAAVIPIPFQAAYSASKAAVNCWTAALRLEVQPFGVRVCAVMPGDTRTGFTDARDKSEFSSGYGDRLNRSVKKMEKDERGGKPPESVAKVVCKLLGKKNPPLLTAVGWEYKAVVFFKKILPERFVLFLIKKLYA